ncbi:MAG: peptidase M56, BlaR1, partial [Bacteroidota bacterium]
MMIPYIVHVSIIIAVCFIFYKIFLQKETFFRLNRWVLLAFIAVSFSLPFLPVPANLSLRNTIVKAVKPITTKPVNNIAKVQTIAGENTNPSPSVSPVSNQKDERISWTKWLYYLYISGIIIFGANLLFQFIVLMVQCYTRPYVQDGPFRIIEISGNRAPCSFGNFIFINPSKYDWETYNQILQHEKIHCSQKHSLDILLAEIVLVFQWFNPFAWLYRKQVETNL